MILVLNQTFKKCRNCILEKQKSKLLEEKMKFKVENKYAVFLSAINLYLLYLNQI